MLNSSFCPSPELGLCPGSNFLPKGTLIVVINVILLTIEYSLIPLTVGSSFEWEFCVFSLF